MPGQSLGEKLKELREKEGLTREQLYSKTKINVKYIEALEEGRWDLLPGQAYLRPFIKNMAEALGADYDDLIQLIETAHPQPIKEVVERKKRGFDFRWLTILLLAALIAIIVFIIKPLSNDNKLEPLPGQTDLSSAASEPEHAVLDRDFSSGIDMQHQLFEEGKVQRIELTATDSVWLVLTSAGDTVFTGTLDAGRSIIKESLHPFGLYMGRLHCLKIKYNGVNIAEDAPLMNKYRLNFAGIDVSELSDTGR